MFKPSAWHIVVLVIALVVLFGWKSLPNMARSLGQSMRIFKSEVDQMKEPSAASQDTVRGERADDDDHHHDDRERGGSRLRDRAADLGDRAKETASDLGEKARDTAEGVRDHGASVRDEFRDGLRGEAGSDYRDEVHDAPRDDTRS